MNPAKIRLSQKEQEMIINAELILTKNRILEKVKALLLEIQEGQEAYLRKHPVSLPPASLSPKISKGENYKGLPYLVLDFPRSFSPSAILAVRVMFWWGHFFSITLHLSGSYKQSAEERIIEAFALLKQEGYWCCINDDPWVHDFETSNYVPADTLTEQAFLQLIKERPFIKLAQKLPIEQWDDIPLRTQVYFQQMMEMIG